MISSYGALSISESDGDDLRTQLDLTAEEKWLVIGAFGCKLDENPRSVRHMIPAKECCHAWASQPGLPDTVVIARSVSRL